MLDLQFIHVAWHWLPSLSSLHHFWLRWRVIAGRPFGWDRPKALQPVIVTESVSPGTSLPLGFTATTGTIQRPHYHFRLRRAGLAGLAPFRSHKIIAFRTPPIDIIPLAPSPHQCGLLCMQSLCNRVQRAVKVVLIRPWKLTLDGVPQEAMICLL